jgi:hypothetical protein
MPQPDAALAANGEQAAMSARPVKALNHRAGATESEA